MSLYQCRPVFLLILLVGFVFLSSCKKEPTGPEEREQPPDVHDTTSHDFQWQVFTLGDGDASGFFDAAVVNDTLAYVSGEMYFKDSTGQWDPRAYNLARWDGMSWHLIRIPVTGPCLNVDYPPLVAIWAFGPDSLLISNGGSVAFYDGTKATLDCGMHGLLTSTINRFYATSLTDIYAVGNAGNIVHYDGSSWQKLASGTTLDVYDIMGATDPTTGEREIYAVAADQYRSFDKAILEIHGTTVSRLPSDSIPYSTHSIWFAPKKGYWVVGSGMYFKHDIHAALPLWQTVNQTIYYTYSISANSLSDIMVCGSYGELLHFNGNSWRSYKEQTYIVGNYVRVAFKGNLCVAVGSDGVHAKVVVGRR